MQMNPCRSCKHDYHSHLWSDAQTHTPFLGRCHENMAVSHEDALVTPDVHYPCGCIHYTEMNNLEVVEWTADKQRYETK